MKALYIPKLELQASLLASKLKENILGAFSINVAGTFLWTHSTTVLQWLHSFDKLTTLVANRVCKKKKFTTVDQWFHKISIDNPADTGQATKLIKLTIRQLRPFKPNLVVVTNIFSKKSVADTIEKSTPALTGISKRSEPYLFGRSIDVLQN